MRSLLVLAAAGLLSSCATVSVKSTFDQSYKGTLQRIAVVSNATNVIVAVPKQRSAAAEAALKAAEASGGGRGGQVFEDKSLSEYLTDSLALRLRKTGLEAEAFYSSGLELDATGVQKRLQSYGPDQVVAINLISGTTIAGMEKDMLLSGVFDASVFDVASQKVVWRARIDVTRISNSVLSVATFDKIMEKIIADLETSGLLVELKSVS